MAATLRGYVSRKGPRLQASLQLCVHYTQHVCALHTARVYIRSVCLGVLFLVIVSTWIELCKRHPHQLQGTLYPIYTCSLVMCTNLIWYYPVAVLIPWLQKN